MGEDELMMDYMSDPFDRLRERWPEASLCVSVVDVMADFVVCLTLKIGTHVEWTDEIGEVYLGYVTDNDVKEKRVSVFLPRHCDQNIDIRLSELRPVSASTLLANRWRERIDGRSILQSRFGPTSCTA